MGRSPTGVGRRPVPRGRQRLQHIVACEGPTERAYFERLGRHMDGVVVIRAFVDKPDPESVVALAVRKRSDFAQAAGRKGVGHGVAGTWAVMDVDTHEHLDESLATARRAQIHAAVSCPCVEVWFILHRERHDAPFASSTAAKKHWESMASQFGPGLKALGGGTGVAIERAAQLESRYDAHVPRRDRNPSTEVGEMVRVIFATGGIDPASIDWRASRARP